MNLKTKNIFSKFSFKKTLIYLNILLVILFLITFCFIGNFVNNNVYKIISIDDDIIVDQATMNSLVINLNIEKFRNIIKNIEEKTIPRKIENFKDIFK